MRISLFKQSYYDGFHKLEQEVNEFLKRNPSIEVSDIKLTTVTIGDSTMATIMVIYK